MCWKKKQPAIFITTIENWNYYTAELYAGFFFTQGKVCGENNIVSGAAHNVQSKRGLQKHKEQLKMLFFNPGKKIPGIPFIGDKLDVFDEDVARFYDYSIDMADLNGQAMLCVCHQKKRRAKFI